MHPLRRPRRPRRSAGQAIVEIALAIPIFLLCLMGLIEGASYAFAATTLQNAASQGARLASLASTGSETVVQSHVIEAARPIALSDSNVTVSINDGLSTFTVRATGDRVRVSVRFDYRPMTAAAWPGLVVALAADAEYMVE